MAIIHVPSVSGGKDSAAILTIAVERFGAHRVKPIFCDTGNEHQAVYEYLDYLEKTLGVTIVRLKADFSGEFARKRMFIARDQRTRREYDTVLVFEKDGKTPVPKRDGRGNIVMRSVKRDGIMVHEPVQKTKKIGVGRKVRWTNKGKRRAMANLVPSGNPFLDLCMLKGRFPSRKAQFCTERLKRDMAVDFQIDLALSGNTVISWQGVRRDESHARRNAKLFEKIGPRMFAYRPIVEWSAADVFTYCASRGIKPNPLYKQEMSRVGCMPCINCGKDELAATARRFPDHIQRISDWETTVSLCSKRGASTFFHKVEGGDNVQAIFSHANIHQTIEWAKTTRGGKQYNLLAALDEPTACSSAYGLCE